MQGLGVIVPGGVLLEVLFIRFCSLSIITLAVNIESDNDIYDVLFCIKYAI